MDLEDAIPGRDASPGYHLRIRDICIEYGRPWRGHNLVTAQ